MNKSDIKNSIFLIGPACVGKSLLSTELGKSLDMPVVCIDDLIMFIQYENDGCIGQSKQLQDKFIKDCNKDIDKDKILKENLKDEKYRQLQQNRAKEILEIYNNYIKLFGSLKPFRDIVKEYDNIKGYYEKRIESISLYSVLSTVMIQKIINQLNVPVIFDTPAMFGWKLDENKLGENFKKRLYKSKLNAKISQIEHYQNKLLKNSTTVYLEPGKDYEIRNSAKHDHQNKILLKHLDNYVDNANILITTNQFFNQPNNKYFKKRTWFDVKEIATKEKLKNKCNISNICDEIISLRSDLLQTDNLTL